MNGAEASPFANRAHPAVRCASVEALPVASLQDWALVSFADREVDRPGGAWDERDDCWFVALAEDPQGAVSAFKRQVFEVGECGHRR